MATSQINNHGVLFSSTEYYNADTNYAIEDNRINVMKYFVDNYVKLNKCTSLSVRYNGGYYWAYLFIGSAVLLSHYFILEITHAGTEMNLWHIQPNGEYNKIKTL